jgi:diguanylate cyclase (GGDEF)-like protein/PAS domain S-box-containing protein
MKLHNQAKTLLRYQSIGMIGIVLVIIAGIFSYFLFKDNYAHQKQLDTLEKEVRLAQKNQIKQDVKNASEYIIYKNSQAVEELMQQSKEAVDKAYNIAQAIYQQQISISSDEEIQDLILASLRNVRFFHGRGYYFIDGLDSKILLLPTSPQMEGTYSLENPSTAVLMQIILDSVKNEQRAGYSRYKWYAPNDQHKRIEKISYARVFEPFDWLIGTGDYIASFEDDLQKSALQRLARIKSNSNANITVLNNDREIIGQSSSMGELKDNSYLNESTRKNAIDFATSGGGFINLRALSKQQQNDDRLLYVEAIYPLNWVVIADISPSRVNALIDNQKKQIEQQSSKDFNMLIMVLIITALVTGISLVVYNFWLRKLFRKYQNSLDVQQQEIHDNTQKLKLASRVFDSSNDAIVVTDASHRIITANPACLRISGFNIQEVIGKHPRMLGSSHHHDDSFYKSVQEALDKKGYWQGEIWNQHKTGNLYLAWLTVSTSVNAKNEVHNYISIFSDISERKRAEKRLSYLADYDPLTKLSKRHILAKHVTDVISQNNNMTNNKFALMLVDLDRFKNINDSLGHNIGDIVLQRIAKRLSANIRASDTISRLSGDEFIILVNHNKAQTAAARLATRVLRDLSLPLEIGDHDLVVTPSIGISIYPENGSNFDSLLKNADAALNHAKALGRNNLQFFTDDMHQRASEKLTIERGLRLALDKEQFSLHYQAQFDLQSGALIGCEALIRWDCPELGMPPPDKFIPVAEETGLILPIGQWVLDEACKQAAYWKAQGLNLVPIAVNVSSHQFNKNLIKSIQHCLKKHDIEPQLIVVEITESALMKDPEFTKDALCQLRNMGIKIALDDFGTGYSSLAYLKRFPIDKLKIDRAFIMGLPTDQDDLVITRSIIDVACNLNMETIAEGVETVEQLKLLTDLGCNQMQGFYKARPIGAPSFVAEHLGNHNPS